MVDLRLVRRAAVSLLSLAPVVGGSHRHRERLRLRRKRLSKLFTAGFWSPGKNGSSSISIAGFVSLGMMVFLASRSPELMFFCGELVLVEVVGILLLFGSYCFSHFVAA
ncbi:hypothetical protein Rs2_03185 [Raphanus sativus]|nr:hypothetical protein Rs2_03185 [Raphanus sativus]